MYRFFSTADLVMAEQGWMICSVKFSFRSCSQSGFSWGVFGDDFTERAAVGEEITAVEDAPAVSGTGEDALKALSRSMMAVVFDALLDRSGSLTTSTLMLNTSSLHTWWCSSSTTLGVLFSLSLSCWGERVMSRGEKGPREETLAAN